MLELEARLVADASGRAGLPGGRHCRTGPATLALHAYWKGAGLPDHPRIEAGSDGWFWGVPLPDGVYNTLVFLDPRDLRAMPGTLNAKFHRLIAASSLLPAGSEARLCGRIQATDATPYLDEECVTADSIKVGDAALALDPLSSSGVQKAIQSSLAGAAVVNTLLHRLHAAALAQQFYRNSLKESSTRHQAWTQSYYSEAGRTSRFWRERSAAAASAGAVLPGTGVSMPPGVRLRIAPGVEMVELPCVVDRFIEAREAVSSAFLEAPVAYLGDFELSPLLRKVRSGMTPREVVQSWMPRVPPEKGMAIAQWLIARGVLVPEQDSAVAMERREA